MCDVEDCGQSFGYKHLLQRHTARHHSISPVTDAKVITGSSCQIEAGKPSVIDVLTGRAYKTRAAGLTASKHFTCSYPHISFVDPDPSPVTLGQDISPPELGGDREGPSCAFVFSRAYDLRRHLLSEHGLAVAKEPVDRLVARLRSSAE